MTRKGLIRVGALALVTSAAVFAAPGSASASVSNDYVTADSNCQALEFTRVEGGHDHMYVDPTIDTNGGCEFGIWDANAGRWAYGPTFSPAGNQGDVYDGPGMRLYIVVADMYNGGVGATGIPN
ncbi:hypothetical protein A6P39_000760 [Streptomyces sp. FXJ1.172]|uniref:hypothetical protein n=1 Tax=Streptomyces sp. FXJ1.172 TaxID=710705 RepID=UPI0007CFFF54|nr:hypothetical protein [Streptomyces sp. FXJ1.172]WEO92769.1 hypothetical protein A6P39_000760 [Streptomyces sp. FXJ1.172]